MKTLFLMAATLSSQLAFATPDCRAPASVENLAQLIERTFNGSTVNCDDGTSFSTKFDFVCKGSSYHSLIDPDDLTRRADGSEVYVVTVLSEADGALQLTELIYMDAIAYQLAEEPLEKLETAFFSMSGNSFSFYAKEPVTSGSWISSTWFVVPDENPRGYKLYADRAVSCLAE